MRLSLMTLPQLAAAVAQPAGGANRFGHCAADRRSRDRRVPPRASDRLHLGCGDARRCVASQLRVAAFATGARYAGAEHGLFTVTKRSKGGYGRIMANGRSARCVPRLGSPWPERHEVPRCRWSQAGFGVSGTGVSACPRSNQVRRLSTTSWPMASRVRCDAEPIWGSKTVLGSARRLSGTFGSSA